MQMNNMNDIERPGLKVAVIDMNNGHPNQGMRCIKEIIEEYRDSNDIKLDYEVFDPRQKLELPGNEFDVYISSGGPGSPFEGEGEEWEELYFDLILDLFEHNQVPGNNKKYIFLICYSFQLVCRLLKIGEVTRRKGNAFGVFPVHKTMKGMKESLFEGLPDPFFAVDSRDWQVVQPNHKVITEMGASILALEKIRPLVPLERCIMAMRFSPECVGTQFHPEADAPGMTTYFNEPKKRESIIKEIGQLKFNNMIRQLYDPEKIALTQRMLIPGFLDQVVEKQVQVY